MIRKRNSALASVWVLVLTGFARIAAAAPCESLASESLALPGATITSATLVAAGEFVAPPSGRGGPPSAAAPFKDVPAFCRVLATLKPTSDSDIRIEVWMPATGWNGKLQSLGNGAYAGAIGYPGLGLAVAQGYAAASTDTGHTGGSASFATGHPEKLIDFAYRGVHEMTLAAKKIVSAYYGNAAKRAYWNGCSTGGRQALTEAQRFPADYDGIIAGAPANYTSHMTAGQLWIGQAVHQSDASYIPPQKYPAIHAAVLAACDALDGVKDGVLEDPTRCHFDPGVLACKGADGPSCLTAPQVEAAKKIYSGAINPRTKQQIFPGLEPGSENGWAGLAGPDAFAYALERFRFIALKDPNWDFRTLNFDTDVARAEKADGSIMNAIDPNLRPFFGHGGKLLMYHGWNDPLIAPLNSVHYYTSVVDTLGGAARTEGSIRLFMVPGMNHCRGGDGTDTFDAIGTLDQWVENGKAPQQIVASHRANGGADRTRPLCPYPQIAVYKGSGSTDDAASFSCKSR
jgi:feruloyl esterase